MTAALISAAVIASAHGADAPESVPAHGLLLRFKSVGTQSPTVTRRARLVNLYVAKGTPPTPLLPAGPFVATWEGLIDIDLRDYYTFEATGHGHLVMEVSGEQILDTKLDAGKSVKSKEARLSGKKLNAVRITLTSDDQGAAALRLQWSTEEFRLEPVQPKSLLHDPKDKQLLANNTLRHGRSLFAQRRCIQCHQAELPKTAMPDLAADSPDLTESGSRYTLEWMTQWILNPKALRATTRMPRLLHGKDAPQQAADLAAFLLGANKATADATAGTKAAIKQGQALYVGLGCTSCHTLAKPRGAPDAFGRTPHHLLAAKWQPAALTAFLKKPNKHYKWIRMPDFRLSDVETNALSAYLLTTAVSPLPKSTALQGDATRGKTLFASVGCANCHTANPGNIRSTLKSPPLASLVGKSGGCVTHTVDAAKHPTHGLTPTDSKALASLLTNGMASLNQHTPTTYALRQIQDLRCVSCHKFDGEISHWSKIKDGNTDLGNLHVLAKNMGHKHIGDKQDIPTMTWFGEKFRPSWMRDFVGGQLKVKPRPGVLARMPAFETYANSITVGLAQAHGFNGADPVLPKIDATLATIGRDVIGVTMGLNCNSCHMVNGKPAAGGDPLQTIDFRMVPQRLRREYYVRWMFNPQRIEPTTMMPAFAPGGKNQLQKFFDGDGQKQFEAMWEYMRTLKKPE